MALGTQHDKDRLCASYEKVCIWEAWNMQKGKVWNTTIDSYKHVNMIIPKILYLIESKITHKNI